MLVQTESFANILEILQESLSNADCGIGFQARQFCVDRLEAHPTYFALVTYTMSDVTLLLSKIGNGDQQAAESLLPLVYDELRQLAASRMAGERADHTLQATALVHEAFLRLVGSQNGHVWDHRGHFFAAAAEAMRRILIDRARDRNRLKRANGSRIDLNTIELALDTPGEAILALDEALEKLAEQFPDYAKLVKLRFFGGLTQHQAAEILNIPRRTADRQWAFARAWLYKELRDE